MIFVIAFTTFFFFFSTCASEIDTFNIPQYKICNRQLKKCLSLIEIEQRNKLHQKIGLVVVSHAEGSEEYLLVGCHTVSWLQFYGLSYEVMDNDCVGCSYLNNSICLFFGNEVSKYLSDSIGTVCVADEKQTFKSLLGSEADNKEWRDEFYQNNIIVDPPYWFFKKRKKKFVRIYDDEYDYTPVTPFLQYRKQSDN